MRTHTEGHWAAVASLLLLGCLLLPGNPIVINLFFSRCRQMSCRQLQSKKLWA